MAEHKLKLHQTGLTRLSLIQKVKNGGPWYYTRIWRSAGHPDDGLSWSIEVAGSERLSQRRVLTVLKKLDAAAHADTELLNLWEMPGALH